MQREPQGVELRTILEIAATGRSSQARETPWPDREGSEPPPKRTAKDRTRMVQLVLERLAARRAAMPSGAAAPPSAVQAGREGRGGAPARRTGGGKWRIARIGASRSRDIRTIVEECYRSLLRPLPEEHVILDPMANAEFIVRCRERGATVPEATLNRTLLNNRKAGRHADVHRLSVPQLEPGLMDRVGHAVEIAANLVQRERFDRAGVVPSVDDILCDPDLRRDLGWFADAMHEGIEPLDCHLALLACRKSGRDASVRAASAPGPRRSFVASLRSLDLDDVPECSGAYRFMSRRRVVFVGSTFALRRRIRDHLERGGAGLLPASLPYQVDGVVSIEIYRLPTDATRADLDGLARRLRMARSDSGTDSTPDLNLREARSSFEEGDSVVRRDRLVSTSRDRDEGGRSEPGRSPHAEPAHEMVTS